MKRMHRALTILALTLLAAASARAADLRGDPAQWRNTDLVGTVPEPGDDGGEASLTTRAIGSGCAGEISLGGSIAAERLFQTQPVASGYSSVFYLPAAYLPRLLRFCLLGPAGTDFDLFIDKWTPGVGWVEAVSSRSGDPDEQIDIGYVQGYYRARVQAWRGTGAYTVKIDGRLLDLAP
jgi:hypothetical protein